MKEREYLLYTKRPIPRALPEAGYPGQWSGSFDESDTIPDLETKPKNKDMSNELKPIAFEALAAKEHEDKIGCVEGTLASLYDAKTGTTNGKEWSLQDGILKDGQYEHRVCFAAGQDVSGLKGKRIRISSHQGDKGLSGVYMKVNTYKAKKDGRNHKAGDTISERKIHVTASANIEEVGANGQPSQAAKPASAPSTESRTYSKPPEPEPSSVPVEVRLDDWFRVYDLVDAMAKARNIEFSLTDKKEITTGTVMGFKGPYATYARVIFSEGREQVESTMERNEALVDRAKEAGKEAGGTDSPKPTTSGKKPEPAKEKPAGWRDFAIHDSKLKKDVKLGDMDNETKAKWITWAHKTPSPKSEEGQAARPQVILMDAELTAEGLKKMGTALTKAGMGSEFEQQDVDALCQDKFGAPLEELHFGQLHALFGKDTFADSIAACKSKAAERSPAGPEPEPINTTEEEEDMPG